jgi:hypothetical protein
MISIPDDLLSQRDAGAQARKMIRSALLAVAARRESTAPDAARVDELLVAARDALADAGAWSAEEAVAEEGRTH